MNHDFEFLPLAWDTEFLGFPVARLVTTGSRVGEVEAAMQQARQAGVKLIYWVVEPQDAVSAAMAAAYGARLLDRKATFVLPLAAVAAVAAALPADPAIQPVTVPTPSLLSLAQQSGEYSRFRLDEQIGVPTFERLYETWLLNSLSGAMARVVLAEHNEAGQARGLLTLGEKNGRADIGLLAVDATARGQGIGRRLVAQAQRQARSWAYQQLQVVTQLENEGACRFYESCGFELTHVAHVYHLWLAAHDQ